MSAAIDFKCHKLRLTTVDNALYYFVLLFFAVITKSLEIKSFGLIFRITNMAADNLSNHFLKPKSVAADVREDSRTSWTNQRLVVYFDPGSQKL